MFIVTWSKTVRGLCFHVIIQYQLGGIKQEINVDVCRDADENVGLIFKSRAIGVAYLVSKGDKARE